jgi:hypothetical protein
VLPVRTVCKDVLVAQNSVRVRFFMNRWRGYVLYRRLFVAFVTRLRKHFENKAACRRTSSCLLAADGSAEGLVVTIRTARFHSGKSAVCAHGVFMCFVWISEQTAIISLHSIN